MHVTMYVHVFRASLQPNEVVSKLYAAHQKGNTNAGVDIEVEWFLAQLDDAL